jgi:hypothetical protein
MTWISMDNRMEKLSTWLLDMVGKLVVLSQASFVK